MTSLLYFQTLKWVLLAGFVAFCFWGVYHTKVGHVWTRQHTGGRGPLNRKAGSAALHRPQLPVKACCGGMLCILRSEACLLNHAL